MTDPNFRVETELRSATQDLASELGGPPPPFRPTSRKSPIFVALLLLVGAGGLAYNLQTRDQPAQVATPPSVTVAPDSSTTAPVDGSVPDTDDEVVVNTNPVIGPDTQPADPNWSKPAFLETYIDDAYSNAVRRVTDAPPSERRQVQSSMRSIENVDGTLLLVEGGRVGDDFWLIVDRSSGDVVRELEVDGVRLDGRADPRWHPTNPDVVRVTAGSETPDGHLRIDEIDVRTGAETMAADLTETLRATWPTAQRMTDGINVGASSADGNRYVWRVLADDGTILGLAVYDLATDQMLGTTDVYPEESDAGLFRWAAMSATGQYVIATYGSAIYVYDADLTNERLVHPVNNAAAPALDAEGNDVLVVQSFVTGDDAGWLLSIDLATLARTKIFDLFSDDGNTNVHISGTGYDRPGWVAVSTYGCNNDAAWSCDKVMMVELAPNGSIVNVAHTNACGKRGLQGTVVVNAAMTRAYFNSDGGVCDIEKVGTGIEIYEATLPTFE